MNKGGNDLGSELTKAKWDSKIHHDRSNLYRDYIKHPTAQYTMTFKEFKKNLHKMYKPKPFKIKSDKQDYQNELNDIATPYEEINEKETTNT